MNDSIPTGAAGIDAEVNHPNISQTSSYHQSSQAVRVGQMAFVQMEAPTFLVREEGFNAEPFFVPVAGLLGQIQIGDQINWLFVTFPPPGISATLN